MGIFPCYTHIINPKLKNIYLSFDEHGELVIKSPKVSIDRIEKLIISKANWINKTQIKIKNKKSNCDNLTQIYYLGKLIDVTFMESKSSPRVDFNSDNGLTIYAKTDDKEVLTSIIDKFYQAQSLEYITKEVQKYSKIMSLYPIDIKYRKTKRQWGSCSGKNNLSFNTMLMKLNPSLIEYVVIHELAHIQHKNHQKQFWELVEEYSPSHKKLRKELKEYA